MQKIKNFLSSLKDKYNYDTNRLSSDIQKLKDLRDEMQKKYQDEETKKDLREVEKEIEILNGKLSLQE